MLRLDRLDRIDRIGLVLLLVGYTVLAAAGLYLGFHLIDGGDRTDGYWVLVGTVLGTAINLGLWALLYAGFTTPLRSGPSRIAE